MTGHKGSLGLALLSAAGLYLTGCGSDSGKNGNPFCASGTYVGDLAGMQATARVSFEVLRETTIVAGEIRSAVAYYVFQGDLSTDPWSGSIASSGYVDVTDMGNGERFRAQITFSAEGFTFMANAFEGLYSTTYYFFCSK